MIRIIYKSILLSLINLIVFNLSAIAVKDSSNSKSITPVFKAYPDAESKHKFSLGLELFPYSYTEPNLMKIKGVFYGINGSYSFSPREEYFVRFEARLVGGSTDYSSNGTGDCSKKAPNKLFETRILYNKYFQTHKNVGLTPFIGLGFRYKEDDSTGFITTTGHTSYLRESRYLYVPVGILMNYSLQKGWGLSVSGEYDIFLVGSQKSSYLGAGFERHQQRKGYGLRSEILLEKTFDKYILSIGPYINYWNIRDSQKLDYNWYCSKCQKMHTYYSLEPKNYTTEIGVKMKITF